MTFWKEFVMKKILVLILSLGILTGCNPSPASADLANYPVKAVGFEDCTFGRMTAPYEVSITVVRCPNSTTTTNYNVPSGKSSRPVKVVVIDDIEYVPKESPQSQWHISLKNPAKAGFFFCVFIPRMYRRPFYMQDDFLYLRSRYLQGRASHGDARRLLQIHR